MIGSSQGGSPTLPRNKGSYSPAAPNSGYASHQAWQQAGAPKSIMQKPTAGGVPSIGGWPEPQPNQPRTALQRPQYISDEATENSVNNTIAEGVKNADQRYQLKQTDRAGFSRGSGAKYFASQHGAAEMGKAAAEAAQTRSQDQMQNAQMRSDYEQAREKEAQSIAMTQHAFNQANWAQQFAQQQAATQLMMSLMAPGNIPQMPQPPRPFNWPSR